LKTIRDKDFSDCLLLEVIIFNSFNIIFFGDNIFSNYSSLYFVNFANLCQEIPDNSFSNSVSLLQVIFCLRLIRTNSFLFFTILIFQIFNFLIHA
jgi:hypothetical protein